MATKKYRIMFVIDSLAGGGAERVMAQLANKFNKEIFEVLILMTLGEEIKQNLSSDIRILSLRSFMDKKVNKSLFILNKIKYHVLVELLQLIAPATDFDGSSWIEKHRSLYRHLNNISFCASIFAEFVRVIKPDCILSFLPLTNMICILARKKNYFSVPIIISDRNYLSLEINGLPWSKYHFLFVKHYYNSVEHHVAVSNDCFLDLNDNFGIPSSKITTIYNGVDLDYLRIVSSAPLEIEKDDTRIHLIAAGRLHRQKGFDILLKALSLSKMQNWYQWILGVGPEKKYLDELSKTLGLSDRVKFLGFDSNPWRWFARADIFILSSRWEGFPNVLLEAMALGLPVIATDCLSGPSEILSNGKWGKLIPPESPEEMAASIDSLLESSSLRLKLAAQSVQRAQYFNLEYMVNEYEKIVIKMMTQ